MARTPSTMLELGTSAPSFLLPDPLAFNDVALSDFQGKPILVMFICNHCPFVIHILDELIAFAHEYQEKGLSIVAINSNDVENYPQDSPVKMSELAAKKQFGFPYLYDAEQTIAKAYEAACTPDFFLFDEQHCLAYRGQFDDTRPQSDVPVTGEDLRKAADAVLAGEQPSDVQKASLGCNIKWRAGNEPEYFG